LEFYIAFFVFIFGLAMGSFFNVLIYRLPRDEFFKNKRSVCPSCGHTIPFYDNIPLISFIVLRAKCRFCRAPISPLYPFVELLTALFALFLFFSQDWIIDSPWDLAWQAGTSFILLFLLPVSIIDLQHRIIPDSISVGGLAAALILAALPQGRGIIDALLGMLCGGGVLYALAEIGDRVFKKESMGGGDIKLMAMAGAVLGWKMVFLALFIGSVIGAIMGIFVLILKKRHDFPFGPGLSMGILITYLFGMDIIIRYFELFNI
jgi:leader peptidase (prepilin peptidase)/N-methyltransferase